jgi:hypothetical protein
MNYRLQEKVSYIRIYLLYNKGGGAPCDPIMQLALGVIINVGVVGDDFVLKFKIKLMPTNDTILTKVIMNNNNNSYNTNHFQSIKSIHGF